MKCDKRETFEMSAINAPNPECYRAANGTLPEHNRLWPLYGAGFENSTSIWSRPTASTRPVSQPINLRTKMPWRPVCERNASAAIGGLEGVPEGLATVAGGRFAGKVVIFPNLNKPLPLTPLSELGAVLPTVAALLAEDGSWTRAAEEEMFRVMR